MERSQQTSIKKTDICRVFFIGHSSNSLLRHVYLKNNRRSYDTRRKASFAECHQQNTKVTLSINKHWQCPTTFPSNPSTVAGLLVERWLAIRRVSLVRHSASISHSPSVTGPTLGIYQSFAECWSPALDIPFNHRVSLAGHSTSTYLRVSTRDTRQNLNFSLVLLRYLVLQTQFWYISWFVCYI
jgi:hypothetical protein